MENNIDKQIDNTSKPWLWKKGQSGNLKGRPKGSTMKEYIRTYLSKLTDEERDEWLDGINKIELFRMAEGNPQTDITSKGEKLMPQPILGGITNEVHSDHSIKENIKTEETP